MIKEYEVQGRSGWGNQILKLFSRYFRLPQGETYQRYSPLSEKIQKLAGSAEIPSGKRIIITI
ncbi:hypothetical protein [Chryseobacterium shigense]|uniref:hypothetical protein n=1 Tax=Chryseobacterium shigense TaxID=297244 RepID=UPI000F4F1A60|nr:hypothetical protein [Chryseobacterium shigense]